MPGSKPLARPANVIFTYDGSFPGFLCCVFESVYTHQIPLEIMVEDQPPISLMEVRRISTDQDRAERVRVSISKKISPRTLELVTTVFFTCLEEKERKLLCFLLRAYREGGGLVWRMGDPEVSALLAAEKHLLGEAHLLKGFLRFTDAGNMLVSTITPKNFVLPFLARHFTLRYDKEQFLIFDQTHKAALLYQHGQAEFLQVDNIPEPTISPQEESYQALWKRFYNTIAIEGRENHRCRMTHMPKRYWKNMLEVRDLL